MTEKPGCRILYAEPVAVMIAYHYVLCNACRFSNFHLFVTHSANECSRTSHSSLSCACASKVEMFVLCPRLVHLRNSHVFFGYPPRTLSDLSIRPPRHSSG